MQLTADLEEFIDMLLPGDVLLFDTQHPVSNLIKLAENLPVNHAALHTGKGAFLHATAPDATGSAIQESSLELRLEAPNDRTVTALRHVDAVEDQGAAWALRRADELIKQSASYSYLNLVRLIAPCFCRAYHRFLVRPDGTASPRLERVAVAFGSLSAALLDTLATGAEERDMVASLDSKASLTCSEFVYMCFEDLSEDTSLLVPQNLVRWRLELARSRPQGPRLRGLADSSRTETRQEVPPTFELDFSDELLDHGASQVTLRTVKTSDVTHAARQVIWELVKYNMSRDKYERWLHNDAQQTAGVLRDVVTPRDLWSSPSLQPVAVLHRPRGRFEDSTME